MNEKAQRGVASVEIAGTVLQALRSAGRSMGLQELALLTGLAPSRLHHYLVSLVRIGLVRRNSEGRYDLGHLTLELGLAAADGLAAQHASAAWLHRLSAESGEASFFAMPSPRGALIVRWEQGSRPLTVHARLGTIMPILSSATGLTWLAFDAGASAPVLDAELRRLEPGARDQARLSRLAEAAEVRRQGVAVTSGSLIANVNAMSCPVLGRSGQFAGALTVLGLGGYFEAAARSREADLLRRYAEAFGSKLP